MIPAPSLDRLPSAAKRERLAKVVVLIAVLVGVLLGLQYTRYALLPGTRTNTLWGVLNGLIFGFLLVNAIWEFRERRAIRRSTQANTR
jgi:DMSO/TMAO reductase YedYZ heme-binding membrane subunit